MLVVDASCVYEIVTGLPRAHRVRGRLRGHELAAPHLVDVEVLSVVRRDHQRGSLDATAAQLALRELADWPGERFGLVGLTDRIWELRDNVRVADACYVALAEALGAALITMDGRLKSSPGPRCPIEYLGDC